MDSQEVRTALGELQEDPDRPEVWQRLRDALGQEGGDLAAPDALRFLRRARRGHAARGEVDAVAALLASEVALAQGTPDEAALVIEQARVLAEELFDDEGALIAHLRVLELVPDEPAAAEAVTEGEEKRGRFNELRQTYLDEASTAPDEVYKSSMLMRAAEMEFRFGGDEGSSQAVAERLGEALRLDPSNERATRMLERILRRDEKWAELAGLLGRFASSTAPAEARATARVRQARVHAGRLGDLVAAAAAYELLLAEQPANEDAIGFLSEHYSRSENWDGLVALFERQIPPAELSRHERLGDMLQIGMLHWRKRGSLESAEPWFERIRTLEQGNQGMLAFFREFCTQTGDTGRLVAILTAAQKVTPEGPDKLELTQQIARLADEQKDAQKAIEQYKSVLRQNPDDAEARDKLKDLYRRTQGYNALVELLRQQLERTDAGDLAKRAEILREVAALYRDAIKSDTALVSVLNQLIQIDETDVESVRQLIALYEKLGRARDLLSCQQKLADLTADPTEKAELYRVIARRWMDQFSNVQNATTAFEALIKVLPGDPEACQNLTELYKKRRAWPQLFELYQAQVGTLEGAEKLALMTEMAQLAAERLNRGDEAARLYREILAGDPSNLAVLDSLERQAERAKDWPALAEALERRVDLAPDDATRLAVLQKLGTVYGEHMADYAGAVRAWRRVLSLQPGHQRALRVLRDSYLLAGDYAGLEELYASQNDWEGLAEVLSNTADRAKEPAAKVELSYRAAAVLRDKLSQPERAFRSYERILTVDPTDTRAARELIPLYEADEKWARLPALYELLIERAESDAEKVEYLGRVIQICGEKLSDRAGAAAFARRAYEISPTEEGVLATFEETTRAARAWDAFVTALEGRAKELKKKKRRPIELKLAEVYARELGRTAEAVELYKAILEATPDDEVAGPALEAILRGEGRRDDLRWLLGLRADSAPDPDSRVRILREWATLEEDVFSDPGAAAALHRRVLEASPGEPSALRALPRLLLAEGDAAGAASVLESHRDHVDEAGRVEVDMQLAELYLERLGRAADALEMGRRVLAVSPHDARAISLLRRLLSHDEAKESAAEILAAEYAAIGDGRQEAEALLAVLGSEKEPSERRELYVKLCDVYEKKLEQYTAALDLALKAVREFPADLDLWQRADALSGAANRPADLADVYREALRAGLPDEVELALCEQAARHHEERLGDPVGAAPYLERVLFRDPSNERAFTRLKQILTGGERWSELEALYDRAAGATDDPVTKVEMLAEVALVCEEIIEDPAKASRYYERILDVDPNFEVALVALDRLYGIQGRHQDLATLLEKRLGSALGEAGLDMKLRLGKIQLEVLHQPAQAILHVEDILGERPDDPDARLLAERLLEVGELRVRAARILEAVYDARGEVRDLVRVLSIRLHALDEGQATDGAAADEQKELLRRIAQLRDERLRDDAGAFEALSRYVPLEPLDVEARGRLLEIGSRLSAEAQVAQVLEAAGQRADTPGMRGEILTQVAQLYEGRLSNSEKAEETYRKVLEIDPDDAELALPAARALERIYIAAGEREKLRDTLRTQIRLESSTEGRVEIVARLGELCEKVLVDLPGAIAAWTARLEELPSDPASLAALDRLYERTGQHRELVQILEARRDRAERTDERREFMRRAAEVLAGGLGAEAEGIEAWRAIVDEFGPDEQALVALEDLYAKAEHWVDLGDTLAAHLDIVAGEAERLGLLAKLGDLRRLRLSDPVGALGSYRDALTIDATHARSREALEELLSAEDQAIRREAAEILHPIYETDGDSARLLLVLEVEIAAAEDPEAKLAGLEKAIQVSYGFMNDPGRAFGYVERAVREAAGHVELKPWLAELERLATATGRRKDQVSLLREVVGNIFDGDTQFDVTLRIAELSRESLKDLPLAREYFEKAAELRPDDRATLVALEGLYQEVGDVAALLEVLERRTEIAEPDAQKKELLFRRARLLSESGDKARAIDVFDSVLDIDMDGAAVAALEALYRGESRWDDLIALYRRELDVPGAPAADLHVKIAGVAERYLKDSARAFDELEAALDIDRGHAGAIAELEHVLAEDSDPEHRARAASLLEPIYLVRADYDRVLRTLTARLDATDDPSQRREFLTRLAQLYEEQKEDYASALETVAKLFSEDLSDLGIVSELERLAKVAGAEKRLAEIYAAELEKTTGEDPTTARLSARAGELFAKLDDRDRALAFYRRALTFEPESETFFAAVDQLLQRTGGHEERVQLYKQALEHRYEDAERLRLLHVIAGLERSELGRPEDAIATYRQAVDLDETDARALDALSQLYRERGRFAELAEHLLRRAESSATAAIAAQFRLELARLLRGELSDASRALDQLDEIVRTVPTHGEAIAELEALKEDDAHRERVVEILRPLYEGSDDWRRLIKLNEDRYGLARDAGERVSVLRETAVLWEQRGGDKERARRALAIAIELDPEDGDARSDYERLVEATSAWDELSEGYEEVLREHPDLGSKREILAKLAEVHDARRDDPRQALRAYDRLREMDPGELAPLEKMEQLATLLSDWSALDRVLTAKVELVLEDEERASIWRRIGEARRDMLEDQEGAIAAYERAAELDPESTFTLDCLIELLEAKGAPERLVELYQRRVELAGEDDADLKYDLLVRAAGACEGAILDRPRAIEMLGQALAVRPADPAALRSLNRLYRAQEMWTELLDTLRLEASGASSPEDRAAVHKQIAETLASRMSSYEDALDAYGLVLSEVPGDAEAVAAVRKLAGEHEHLRSVAAKILVPVLTQTGKHAELVDVLELRLSTETEPSERAATLRTIAGVQDGNLSRPAEAEGALIRALAEQPDAADLHAEIERLAAASAGWERYADALTERAQGTFDVGLSRDLFTRLGRVAETKLKDERRAVQAYTRAVEQVGDEPDLLEALDRLQAALGDARALAEVLERRVAVVNVPDDRATLHYRLAVLFITEFKEPSRGLSSLRAALEASPDHEDALEELEGLTDQRDLFEEAAEVLEGVYRSRGRTDRLASLFEKRIGFAGSTGERIDMRRNLAKVLEREAGDPKAAQRVLQLGLADDPADSGLLDEIERLAAATGNWEGAAAALRDAVEKKADLVPDVARDLSLRVARWYKDRAEDPQAAEKALEKALEFDPASDEVLAQIEALQSRPGRERDLVQTLRRRAKLQLEDANRDGLYRRAKELADSVGDRELSEAVLREVLSRDDKNVWALAELTGLREAASDYKEVFSLLLRRIDLGSGDAEVRGLRHWAALVARDKLSDAAKATELYARLFEEDPNDQGAASALRQLYEAAGAHDALGRLLERLTDVAASPSDRGTLRLELAKLKAERFKAQDAAIDLLRAALEEEPAREEIVTTLLGLLEAGRRFDDLASLLNARIEQARSSGNAEAERAFQVRLGSLFENELKNGPRAIEVYEAILSRQAEHGGALEALTRLYQAEGDHAKAARTLETLVGLASGGEAVRLATLLAGEYRATGDLGGAASALERGLSVDERNAAVRDPLRKLYEESGTWDKLADLIAGDAGFAANVDEKVKLLRQAASIHATRRSDQGRASELLERASAEKPDDRSLLLDLCDAYTASGRGKAAVEVLERIVQSFGNKRSKDQAEIHRRLAAAYIADGDATKGMDELDKAFRMEPGNVYVLRELGLVSMQIGDLKKAQQMFRALLLQKFEDGGPITKAEVFMHLGDVHLKLGEKPKAVQMLERAIQTDASLEAAKTLLAEAKS